MNERNVSERIVRAVDARLSGLTGDPWMAQHVLARAEEELPNRRKKRAVALIVAAVLALAGMGALAASLLWREQAASMKQVEQTEGCLLYTSRDGDIRILPDHIHRQFH